MIEISKDEIRDKMFFVREENSNQPIAVVKVGDLMKFERPQDNITEEDIQNAIRAGYENGYSMAQAKYQRPQGEWITHITYFECSNCKYCFDYDYAEDIDPVTDLNFNFCPNCGVEMVGGES